MLDARASTLEQLIDAGLAPRRARRILREFREHRDDLIAEQLDLDAGDAQAMLAAGERLGSEQQLVAVLLLRPELRAWSRRSPGLAFALAPLLCFAAAFCLSLLIFIGLVQWRKDAGDAVTRASLTMHWISEFGTAYLLWGLPLLAALMLAAFAARRREASSWPWCGIILTCVVGALTNFSFALPPMTGAPSMTAGIGIGTDHLGPTLARAAGTATLALMGYFLMRRLSRREVFTPS